MRCGVDSHTVDRASSLRGRDVRILQWVEHWTNFGARIIAVQSDVSVLVDGIGDNLSVSIATAAVVCINALELNRVTWELAEFQDVFVALGGRAIDNASGVDGGAKLGGNVRNLGSRVFERIVGVVWLMVVVSAVRVAGCGHTAISRRSGLVALGLRVGRRVVSALRLIVRGGLV